MKAAAIALSVLVFAASAAAQSGVEEIAAFRDWRVFAHGSGADKTCFVAASPQSSRGAEGRRRGPIALYVSNRPSANVAGEVSVAIGYPFRKDAASLDVGGQTYRLFTEGETAWSDGADSAIVAGMKAKRTLTITATSQAGTRTVDSFSLLGFTNAINKLNEECPA